MIKNCIDFLVHDDRRIKEDAGPWTVLHYLVNEILKSKGYVLYYQLPNLSFENTNSENFYQLTLSNQLWLKNA